MNCAYHVKGLAQTTVYVANRSSVLKASYHQTQSPGMYTQYTHYT